MCGCKLQWGGGKSSNTLLNFYEDIITFPGPDSKQLCLLLRSPQIDVAGYRGYLISYTIQLVYSTPTRDLHQHFP